MSEYDPPTDHIESGAEDAYLQERDQRELYITNLEARITELESELAATKRECEGLREAVDDARECARCEYPTSKNGFAPWDDCGHCIGCQCKAALAARDATEGGV